MAILQYQPWSLLADLERSIQANADTDAQPTTGVDWQPDSEVVETQDAFLLSLDVPGVKQSDIEISSEDQQLTIKGNRVRVAQDANKTHFVNRVYGSFAKTYRLPDTVDGENIKARLEDGVLSIALPKQEQAKPRKISVDIE